jgi:hypothetical protein
MRTCIRAKPRLEELENRCVLSLLPFLGDLQDLFSEPQGTRIIQANDDLAEWLRSREAPVSVNQDRYPAASSSPTPTAGEAPLLAVHQLAVAERVAGQGVPSARG